MLTVESTELILHTTLNRCFTYEREKLPSISISCCTQSALLGAAFVGARVAQRPFRFRTGAQVSSPSLVPEFRVV